ncbi:MAG: NAD(+) synthase [Bacteroidales bacterium]|nr:NAD(+) synthase [Bacteroidales bacterium]MBN2757329.1 NAD(+) synthase [Bacteroidales bacterium]
MKNKPFTKNIIKLEDIEKTCNNIIEKLKDDVYNKLQRKGGIVGISGGIDSSVTLALAVKAFGKENVTGILLPEKDSSPDSAMLANKLAEKFGIKTIVENISDALDGFGCYRRRDEAMQRVFPEYDPKTYKSKIAIKQDVLNQNMPSIFSLVIIDKNGNQKSKMLPMNEYLQIVAASNFKQRSRMSMLYYHAEALHYAVIGTPNKHEVEQGFFVKYGDGGADVMPIGDLYKSQVYEIAAYLGVPQEIIDRTPTTDTYSAEQTQEEFFYQLPFELMDLIWYGWENDYDTGDVAYALNLKPNQIEHVYKTFERKMKTTEYLRLAPIRDYK